MTAQVRPARRAGRSARWLAAACVLASGCQSWHTQNVPVPQAIEARYSAGAVRITRRDQGVFEMRNPVLVGDSIIGLVGEPPQRHAIAVADVARVDARKVSATRTAGLVVGTYLVVVAVAVVAVLAVALNDFD